MNSQALDEVKSTHQKVPRRHNYTGDKVSPTRLGKCIAMRAQGMSISLIARELKMSPNTINAILRTRGVEDVEVNETIKAIVPEALEVVQQGIKVKRDINLAIRYLENTVFNDRKVSNVTNSPTVNVAVGLLSPTTSGATQAPAKSHPAHAGVPSHGQNFPLLAANQPVINTLAEVVDAELVSSEVEPKCNADSEVPDEP